MYNDKNTRVVKLMFELGLMPERQCGTENWVWIRSVQSCLASETPLQLGLCHVCELVRRSLGADGTDVNWREEWQRQRKGRRFGARTVFLFCVDADAVREGQ